jgi:hypothetical protein
VLLSSLLSQCSLALCTFLVVGGHECLNIRPARGAQVMISPPRILWDCLSGVQTTESGSLGRPTMMSFGFFPHFFPRFCRRALLSSRSSTSWNFSWSSLNYCAQGFLGHVTSPSAPISDASYHLVLGSGSQRVAVAWGVGPLVGGR